MTERTKTPHPHAALMAQYAEECKEDAEAWRNWDFRAFEDSSWRTLSSAPCWLSHDYRRRPKPVQTIVVNGVTVEAPMRQAPESESYYFVPNLRYRTPDCFGWGDSLISKWLLENGLVFSTDAAAQAFTEAAMKPVREYVAGGRK